MKPKKRKSRDIQKKIAGCLKTGLPLAGLVATLLVSPGCDDNKTPPDSPLAGDVPYDVRTSDGVPPTEPPLAGDVISAPEAIQQDDAQSPQCPEKPAPETEPRVVLDLEPPLAGKPAPLPPGMPAPPPSENQPPKSEQ